MFFFLSDSIQKETVFKAHVDTVRLRPFYHKLASRQGAHIAPVPENIQTHALCFSTMHLGNRARGLGSCTPRISQNLCGRYMFEPSFLPILIVTHAQAQLGCKSRRHPSWHIGIEHLSNLDAQTFIHLGLAPATSEF